MTGNVRVLAAICLAHVACIGAPLETTVPHVLRSRRLALSRASLGLQESGRMFQEVLENGFEKLKTNCAALVYV